MTNEGIKDLGLNVIFYPLKGNLILCCQVSFFVIFFRAAEKRIAEPADMKIPGTCNYAMLLFLSRLFG